MEKDTKIEKEMDASSSLFFLNELDNIDVSINSSEYRSKLKEDLQIILNKIFPNDHSKRQIKESYNRISCACPYCGDSYGDIHKKRGNFILSGKYANYFKCFNCGEFKRIDTFFKDYNMDLDLSMINYIHDNASTLNSIRQTTDNSILYDTEELNKYAVDKEVFKNHYKLEEISNNNIQKWLRDRLQFNNDYFYYDPNDKTLVIMNLTSENKIIGYQKRYFNNSTNKYKIHTLENIHQFLNTNIEVPDYINNISNLFNICICDINKPVTLFEGPLDSLLFKNSIALGGANKTLPIDLPVRYWFDDDKTGKEMSLDKINNNEIVFLWNKYKNDIGLPFRKKWDLTDVLVWSKQSNIKLPRADIYFSNDIYDIIDI